MRNIISTAFGFRICWLWWHMGFRDTAALGAARHVVQVDPLLAKKFAQFSCAQVDTCQKFQCMDSTRADGVGQIGLPRNGWPGTGESQHPSPNHLKGSSLASSQWHIAGSILASKGITTDNFQLYTYSEMGSMCMPFWMECDSSLSASWCSKYHRILEILDGFHPNYCSDFSSEGATTASRAQMTPLAQCPEERHSTAKSQAWHSWVACQQRFHIRHGRKS